MSARDAILGRLREAEPAQRPPLPDVADYYAAAASQVSEPLMERFLRQARAWRTEIIECTPTDWAVAVERIVSEKGLQKVLAGRDTALSGVLGVALGSRIAWFDQNLEDFKPALFADYDAGITTCWGAVAETGSLLLWPDAREPRTLSLVPPIHIAVLRASRLYPRMADAMREAQWAAGMPSNLVMVSGPSKTSDIQRVLAYGAHGPKELVIVLIHDEHSTGGAA